MSDNIQRIIEKAIDTEIESIIHFRKNMNDGLVKATKAIFESKGKLIMTGVGKSGDIAKKISSTMSSTGTPSVFMHPTDAAHGDAGIITSNDTVIAIGKSGESDELLSLLPTIKSIGARIISITANPESRLAKDSDIVILTPVLKEACPLELAPTSSTTIALIVGDAIAMALMELRGFKEDNFALYHPAGRLGKRLSLNIEDVMRKDKACAVVSPETTLPDILSEITGKGIGATAVVSPDNKLAGMITDFDIRKLVSSGNVSPDIRAEQIMNSTPITFSTGKKAYDILLAMENRERPISVAPIVSDNGKLAGIISLHDLLQRGLK